MTASTPPHILTLVNDDEHDDEVPLFWTSAELACPHQPPTALMSCAAGERCGCPDPTDAQTDEWGRGDDRCPASATGRHSSWEGEWYRPKAECWPVHHADHLDRAAMELRLGTGRHEVWPICEDGDRLGLLLADPAVSAAKQKAMR